MDAIFSPGDLSHSLIFTCIICVIIARRHCYRFLFSKIACIITDSKMADKTMCNYIFKLKFQQNSNLKIQTMAGKHNLNSYFLSNSKQYAKQEQVCMPLLNYKVSVFSLELTSGTLWFHNGHFTRGSAIWYLTNAVLSSGVKEH